MALTYLPFSIVPLVVAPLLTSPLLLPLLPFPAPGRCLKTWVLIIYQFFYLSLSHRSIASTSLPLPSIFRKLARMTLPCTLTLTVLLQRSRPTHLFLFSVSQPKALRSRARGYLSEFPRATCSEESHLFFCSPFSHAKFFAAASNPSFSTTTGPDKAAYPMLMHLPRSGMNFLLHYFNLFCTLHSFPSIWKTSSIILIHKMGKTLDSPASFRPISLTSCVSKVFERIILSCLLSFLESNFIFSFRQEGCRTGRSTLD